MAKVIEFDGGFEGVMVENWMSELVVLSASKGRKRMFCEIVAGWKFDGLANV